MARASDSPWTPPAIASLRQLWAEGHSVTEIGRRLRISRNAVIGKVHRLGLAGRASPIRRDHTARSAHPRPRRPKPIPLAELVPEPFQQPVAAAPPAQVKRTPSPLPQRVGTAPCCWPVGEPGKAGFSILRRPGPRRPPLLRGALRQAYAPKQTAHREGEGRHATP